MIVVAGENKDHQLGVESNNKAINESPIVCPPDNLKLDITSLLSFSVYCGHAVWITLDGKAHAIGDNKSFEISKSLPEGEIKQSSIFEINDNEGKPCIFLSALCGYEYTLFLVQSNSSNQNNRLIYSHSSNKKFQLFLNISGHNPVALFGGYSIAAAIDSNGEIIIIANPLSPQFISLPGGEKSVQIACGNKYLYSLSASGHVYMSHRKSDSDEFEPFTEVNELKKVKIIQISGTFNHFFAISTDGVTYARGRNSAGCLGTGRGIEKAKQFTQVTSLLNCKIKSAYAGCDHSLFQTEEGKILACGDDCYGEIPLNEDPTEDDIFLPIDTNIKSGSSFSIAGEHLTISFVNCKVPPNIPNKIVTEDMPVAASICAELNKFMASNNNNIVSTTSSTNEKETTETSQSKCCILI